jgi:hypothetical protein
MNIRLYMDENVRIEIMSGLRDRGIDVVTVRKDGMSSAPDPDVLDRANALNRVLFTHDRDFLTEAAARQRDGRGFGGVIYAHPMGVTIGQCIADLEVIAALSNPDELTNSVLRIPL